MFDIIETAENRKSDPEKKKLQQRVVWATEYDTVLESSFLFEAERSGILRVRNTNKKAGEPVPAHECAPFAIL